MIRPQLKIVSFRPNPYPAQKSFCTETVNLNAVDILTLTLSEDIRESISV